MHAFRVERHIGKGSFGTAVLATEVATGRQFVVKQVNMSRMDAAARARALSEVNVLRAIRHPCVIGYHRSFVADSTLHIVLDYAEGGDMGARVTAARRSGIGFPEPLVVKWFTQTLLGLRCIHSHRVLHRDVKPHNIFLTRSGDVKIGDFGISKTLDSTLELANTWIGTPYHCSPELCTRRPYGYATDMWSLGVVLYELLTLQHPFEAGSLVALVHNIMLTEPTPPRDTAGGRRCSPELAAIAMSLLNKEPSKRPTAAQLLRHPFLVPHVHRARQKAAAAAARKPPPVLRLNLAPRTATGLVPAGRGRGGGSDRGGASGHARGGSAGVGSSDAARRLLRTLASTVASEGSPAATPRAAQGPHDATAAPHRPRAAMSGGDGSSGSSRLDLSLSLGLPTHLPDHETGGGDDGDTDTDTYADADADAAAYAGGATGSAGDGGGGGELAGSGSGAGTWEPHRFESAPLRQRQRHQQSQRPHHRPGRPRAATDDHMSLADGTSVGAGGGPVGDTDVGAGWSSSSMALQRQRSRSEPGSVPAAAMRGHGGVAEAGVLHAPQPLPGQSTTRATGQWLAPDTDDADGAEAYAGPSTPDDGVSSEPWPSVSLVALDDIVAAAGIDVTPPATAAAVTAAGGSGVESRTVDRRRWGGLDASHAGDRVAFRRQPQQLAGPRVFLRLPQPAGGGSRAGVGGGSRAGAAGGGGARRGSGGDSTGHGGDSTGHGGDGSVPADAGTDADADTRFWTDVDAGFDEDMLTADAAAVAAAQLQRVAGQGQQRAHGTHGAAAAAEHSAGHREPAAPTPTPAAAAAAADRQQHQHVWRHQGGRHHQQPSAVAWPRPHVPTLPPSPVRARPPQSQQQQAPQLGRGGLAARRGAGGTMRLDAGASLAELAADAALAASDGTSDGVSTRYRGGGGGGGGSDILASDNLGGAVQGYGSGSSNGGTDAAAAASTAGVGHGGERYVRYGNELPEPTTPAALAELAAVSPHAWSDSTAGSGGGTPSGSGASPTPAVASVAAAAVATVATYDGGAGVGDGVGAAGVVDDDDAGVATLLRLAAASPHGDDGGGDGGGGGGDEPWVWPGDPHGPLTHAYAVDAAPAAGSRAIDQNGAGWPGYSRTHDHVAAHGNARGGDVPVASRGSGSGGDMRDDGGDMHDDGDGRSAAWRGGARGRMPSPGATPAAAAVRVLRVNLGLASDDAGGSAEPLYRWTLTSLAALPLDCIR